MKIDNDENIKKAEELRKQSEQAYLKRDEYEELMREQDKLGDKLILEAVELIAPFKQGDIIEYETKVGWRNPKTQKRRIVADRLYFTNQGVGVGGRQVTVKGDIFWRERLVADFFTDSKNGDNFLRVVGHVESGNEDDE